MASSMASFVPEPIEKCAVWAASPTTTVRPWCQTLFTTFGKSSQSERFERSSWPSRSRANSRSQKARLSSSDSSSRPARRHVASGHSTMNVLVRSSKGYACTWKSPCPVSLKMNVKASKTRSVPNQTYLQPSGATDVPSSRSSPLLTTLLTPSAPTTRSASSGAPSSSTPNARSTPREKQRRWRISRSRLRAIAEKEWPCDRRTRPR